MIVKLATEIYVEVENDEEAEEAASTMDTGLNLQLANFPDGEVLAAKVRSWLHVSSDEADEVGLREDEPEDPDE